MSENLLELIDCEDVLISECKYLQLDDDVCYDRDKDNSFVVSHLNIHGLLSKHGDLVELIDILNEKNLLPDIILLCETFLNEANHTRVNFDNYIMVSEYRKHKSRGGVSIMVRPYVNYLERSDLRIFEEGKFESVFIEIMQKGRPSIVVGEIYRVPGTDETEFIENYKTIIDKIKSEHKRLIIGSDQNLDYLKINSHSKTMNFFDLNLTNNIIPTIYKPTRVTHKTATLIDNIYLHADLLREVRSFIVECDLSDHFMCIAVIHNKLQHRDRNDKIKIRNITDSNLRNMNASLSNRNWNELENMSVDEGSEILINEITKVMDFYAPERTAAFNASHYKGNEPWFTKGLMVSSRNCFSMFRKVAKKPRDGSEYKKYKEYRNMFNKLRRKAKFSYYNCLILKNKENSKNLWAVLNRLTGKINNKKEITNEIIVNGVKENNARVISNAFAKYYCEVGKTLANKIEQKGNIADPMTFLNNKVKNTCFLFPTTGAEIEKFIRSLKLKHSCGLDRISNRILKSIYPGIINALRIIFNKSLLEGHFPRNMKTALIKPIYKGKSNREIVNYRPVSLLSVLSKILEKIVNERIVGFFTKHKLFYEGQYGFRQGRSTTDAILDLTGSILESFNKSQYTLGLFLDMSKAFDSINHNTLFRKLEYYGIRGTVLSWVKSYLLKRKIKVKFKSELSENYEMMYGTPQGSVLGPIMYIILANDLNKSLKFCRAVSFADDTTIFASGNNLKFLYKKVNADLMNLSKWFDSNSLTLNVEKSKYILFRPKSKAVNYNGKIEICGIQIDKVQNARFLGIILNEFLDWEPQVKHVLTKIIAGNYSISMIKNMLPLSSKLLIYYAHVQSHINYALSVWGPMVKAKDLKKIRIQQNKSIRLLFNVSPRTSMSAFYKKGHILKFDDLVRMALLKISHRYMNDSLPVRISNLFEVSSHDYLTRNRNLLRALHHTSDLYNKSYLGKAPSYWLHLRNNLRDINRVKSFAAAVTKTILENY